MPGMRSSERSSGLDLSIVVPVYRSEECLPALISAIDSALAETRWTFEVVLVNDGSPDGSWRVIESLCGSDPRVVGVNLRKNFGQDNAILTGLRLACGRYVAVMDDDLQHDPHDLLALLDKIDQGFDVVYARFVTKHQKLWKNLGSWFNGRVAEWVIAKPRDVYLSPYKVIRKEVADLLCDYGGPDPYIDGLLFQVTSAMAQIPATHHPRFAGHSTYTFWKSVRVWTRLAFSFSVKPLRLVSWFGLGFATLGMVFAVLVILYRLLFPEDFPTGAVGWASLMVALLVIGGIQMFFFGILGEYAGRTYLRVNDKPQAAIREVLNSGVKRDASQFDRELIGRQVTRGN
jgi:polyisoprenyl-phosphate glycosyltransferase